MANTQKFTEEEIQSINELKKSVSIVFTQLGQLSIQKARTLQQIEINETFDTKTSRVVFSEQELFKGLNEKYGDGNYDLILENLRLKQKFHLKKKQKKKKVSL